MIRSSVQVKLVLLLLAGAAHAALAMALLPDTPPQIEGASGRAEVSLGNAFSDLVAGGAMTAAPVTNRAAPVAPPPTTTAPPSVTTALPAPLHSPATPLQAAPVETAATQNVIQDTLRSGAKSPGPQPAETVATVAPTADPTPAAPVRPAHALAPIRPALSATTARTAARQPRPPQPAPPVQAAATPPPAPTPSVTPQPVPLASPQETVSGTVPATGAVARSRLPQPRSPEFEAAHQPAPTSSPASRPAGNANASARAGVATGNATSRSPSSGGQGQKPVPGNAAVSNYPGVVMRCVSQVGRPQVAAQGTARVSFTVSGSGRIGGVGLSRSSGNAALDRAALALVRRAGPCPRPPSGAQRKFAIGVKAR